jgi:hypothetical protein
MYEEDFSVYQLMEAGVPIDFFLLFGGSLPGEIAEQEDDGQT